MTYFQSPYDSKQPSRCCCHPNPAVADAGGTRIIVQPSPWGGEGTALEGSPLMDLAVQTRVNDAFRIMAQFRASSEERFIFEGS